MGKPIALIAASILLLGAVFWLADCYTARERQQHLEASSAWRERQARQRRQARTDETLQSWLAAQKCGQDGHQFWAGVKRPVSLFAVSDAVVVDSLLPSSRVVRIRSSRRDGTPIVQLWRIYFDEGSKITDIELAQQL